VEIWKVTMRYGQDVQIVQAIMTNAKKIFVVSTLLLSAILLKVLAVKLTNGYLTPVVGNSYGSYQKIIDRKGNELGEYNQVLVYKCTSDSVFYILTKHNGIDYCDSLASTTIDFSKLYK
jgi:hypothetical protein